MIKAVIFDMDGVLVDSEPLHYLAHKRAFGEVGIKLTLQEYLKEGVAMGDKHLFETMAKKYGKEIDPDKIRNAKFKYFRQLLLNKLQLRNGVPMLLHKLFGRYRLAVASSARSDVVQGTLQKFEIADFFETTTTADDVEKVKPDPEIYLASVKKLGLDPSQCVAIEDSEAGVQSAKRAGLQCIAAPTKFTEAHDFSRADSKVKSLEEINIDQFEAHYA